MGNTLTITGTQLISSDPASITSVKVGNSMCAITATVPTATQIVCTMDLAKATAGSHNPIVNVTALGDSILDNGCTAESCPPINVTLSISNLS